MSPTIRAARAFLASPRSDLRPPAYGRAEALGLRARGIRPEREGWHPSDPMPPQPAPVIAPTGATISHLSEHQAVRDVWETERARDHAAADALAPLVDLAVARLTGRPTA